ncbi:hypothetical protein AJ79_00143 [Helicocarpus griseus UAMH5409]|uniref:HMG box domain-containing protein n=1 Tax=Helicocarpus griseus UAMH5409 TaxID=1447875 RepID=A0A2B7YDE9_9EURO|nr:hypothetical protein AJ79_00143 [Helicocarpus griseus UAMH5409]
MSSYSRATTPGLSTRDLSTHSLVDSIERAIHPLSAARHELTAATEDPNNQTALTYIQVIVSLATLQSAVSDLSRAYINHANTVLNRGPSTLDLGGITSSLLENGLLSGGRGLSPGARPDTAGGKKKRKRAPHDPNAPKRALTPYFLYMQHNRANIARELGENARPKEVADEGTKRWAEMPDNEKKVWKDLYAANLRVYQEKMKAYKAGLPVPEDESTEAAAQLHQGVHHAVEEASTEESEESSEEEEDEAFPEPVKEPTPPRSTKRRRTTGEAKPTSTPTTASKKASPEKKKASAKKDEPAAKPKRGAAAAAAVETPKADKKTGKKKRKSEAAE